MFRHSSQSFNGIIYFFIASICNKSSPLSKSLKLLPQNTLDISSRRYSVTKFKLARNTSNQWTLFKKNCIMIFIWLKVLVGLSFLLWEICWLTSHFLSLNIPKTNGHGTDFDTTIPFITLWHTSVDHVTLNLCKVDHSRHSYFLLVLSTCKQPMHFKPWLWVEFAATVLAAVPWTDSAAAEV